MPFELVVDDPKPTDWLRPVRLIVNWFMYLTMPLWLPFVFYAIEIILLYRMIKQKPPMEKKCWNYKALFRGDRWFIKRSDFWEAVNGMEEEDAGRSALDEQAVGACDVSDDAGGTAQSTHVRH
jgi:hypothetical protein